MSSDVAFSVCGAISALFCAVNLFLYWRVPELGRHLRPGKLVFVRTWCDLGYGIMCSLAEPVQHSQSDCRFVSWASQFFWAASNFWVVATVFDLLTLVRNPFEPARRDKQMHLFVWTAALACSLLPAQYDSDDRGADHKTCWVLRKSEKSQTVDWSLFYFPLMALIGLSLFIAYRTWVRLNQVTTLGLKVDLWKVRELKQTKRYLGAWLVYWCLNMVALALVRTSHSTQSGTDDLFTLHTTVTGLRGVVGFFIFVLIVQLRVVSVPASLEPKNDRAEPLLAAEPDAVDELYEHNLSNKPDTEQPRTSVPLTDSVALEFDDDSMHVTHLLRHDLVEMTAAGIAHCASEGWGGAFASKQLPASLQGQISAHQSSTGGFRPAVPMPTGARSVELSGSWLDFFDYKPGVFYRIRAALGVDPREYSAAFEDLAGILFQFSIQAAKAQYKSGSFHGKEVGSDGASGSFFYFTKNKAYIVKTISLGEKDALVRIANNYLQHVTAHPDTLIHYYGCHSLRLPMNSGKMYFCVMKNIFHSDDRLAETYDLKGCTTNRRRLNPAALSEIQRGGPVPGTLLDWDWINLGRRINFEGFQEPLLLQLLQALHADSGFLAANELLDYSLLLGVVDHSTRRDSGPSMDRRESFQAVQAEEGERCQNMLLRGADQDYFLGIGDILESWGPNWGCQGAVLRGVLRWVLCGQWQNPDGITAVHHREYAARFFWFMADKMLGAADKLSPEQRSVRGVAVGPEMKHLREGQWW